MFRDGAIRRRLISFIANSERAIDQIDAPSIVSEVLKADAGSSTVA